MSDDSLRGLVPMETRVVQEGLKAQIENAASNFIANPSTTNWADLTQCMYAWQYFLGLGGTDKKDSMASRLFHNYPISDWLDKLFNWMKLENGTTPGEPGVANPIEGVAGKSLGPNEPLTMPPKPTPPPSTVRKEGTFTRTRKAGERQK